MSVMVVKLIFEGWNHQVMPLGVLFSDRSPMTKVALAGEGRSLLAAFHELPGVFGLEASSQIL